MHTADIEAINVYIRNTSPRTPEAAKLQASWFQWYNGLNFVTKALNSTFEEASNRRNIYNAANGHPANFAIAADLTPEKKIDRQAAIAASTDLTPAQKKKALANSPGVPTTHGVPAGSAARPTLKQGSKGGPVAAWQQIVGVKADGNFGPGTAAATKTWQSKNGLTADGVVGPKSWSAALGTTVQQAPVDTSFTARLPNLSPTFAPPKAQQAPLISPAPAVHNSAVAQNPVPAPPIKPSAVAAISSKTIAALKGGSNLKTAGAVGIPTVVGAYAGGPIGALIGAGIGALIGAFAVK